MIAIDSFAVQCSKVLLDLAHTMSMLKINDSNEA